MTLQDEIIIGIGNLLKLKKKFSNNSIYTNIVYLNLYACRSDNMKYVDGMDSLIKNSAIKDIVFIDSLISQNTEFDNNYGWIVTEINESQINIARDGIRAFLNFNEVDKEVKLGDEIIIKTPKIKTGSQFGFVTMQGNIIPDSHNISRIYLSISSQDAPWVLGFLAREINASCIPFSLKVIANPKGYIRHDSCVIYTNSNALEELIKLIIGNVSKSNISLKDNTPLLTKTIYKGIGIADDPKDISDGISYGQWVASLFLDASKGTSNKTLIYKNILNLIEDSGRDSGSPYFRKSNNYSI